jgi:hypothetical protein
MDGGTETTWEKALVFSFKVLYRHLHGETEENNEDILDRIISLPVEIRTGYHCISFRLKYSLSLTFAWRD